MQSVVSAAQKPFAIQHLKHLQQCPFDLGVSPWIFEVMQLGGEMFEAMFPRREDFSGSFGIILFAALLLFSPVNAVVVFNA